MDFTFDDEEYRVERGLGTGRWLLLHNFSDHRGWRLIDSYEASIDDTDIVDAVKSSLKGMEDK